MLQTRLCILSIVFVMLFSRDECDKGSSYCLPLLTKSTKRQEIIILSNQSVNTQNSLILYLFKIKTKKQKKDDYLDIL